MKAFATVLAVFMVTLFAGVAEAKGDGPEGVSFFVSTGGMSLPGAEVMNFDLGLKLRFGGERWMAPPKGGGLTFKNDWALTFTVGTEARLNVPTYRFERLIFGLDLKWQAGVVLGWRLIGRFVPAKDTLHVGFFTGPSLTFGRSDNHEFDIAVVAGKFSFEPGGWTGGYGAAMVVFSLSLGSG